MPKQLKTEWKRIGRSGPTVDGRSIEPIVLEQAAKNYNKGLFTALIWPDHLRWFNMGTVEELRTAANNEGGVDLFAIIAPNDYYLSINAAGQRLFTSMELLPNFRDTGEWYLTGLAATDNPASVATSEMRFNRGADKQALLSTFTETTPGQFGDDQPPGWFTRLFAGKSTPSDEDIMSKQALEALAAQFTALEQKLDALKPADNPGATDNPDKGQSEDYAALSAKLDKLTEQVTALSAIVASGDADKGDNQFKQLDDELKALREDFTKAVNEANGTDAGEHDGGAPNLSTYI